MDRVDNSVRIDGLTVEMPSDDAHEQGTILRRELQKLLPTMQIVNEQAVRLGHDAIHHEAQELLAGEKGHGKSLGSLVDLQGLLMIIDGYLLMTDEEFQHHLSHVQGFFNGVATYSEFVKAATELAGGALMTSAAYAGAVAQQMGYSGAAATCSGLARGAGLVFGNIIAGIEIVHRIAVMFDPTATRQQKIDAGVSVSAGASWFIGRHLAGTAVGAAASTVILATYAELKAVAYLYWESNLGLTSALMRPAFDTLQRDGESIAIAADKLAKVNDLIAQEKDPNMLADLQRTKEVLLNRLAQSLEYLISDCQPRSAEAGVAQFPGAISQFRELFSMLNLYRGVTDEAKVVEGANLALKKITWALTHGADLIVGAAKHRHIDQIAHDVEQRESHPQKHE